MNLSGVAHSESSPRSRTAPRRGSFALEPVDALHRYADRIRDLASHALEPNPFFTPEFLEPAALALGGRKLRLAVVTDRENLHFFAPVRIVGSRFLQVWTHPYAPLGVPLIDRDAADVVSDALFEFLRGAGRNHLAIPHMPLAGPAADLLRNAAVRRGAWREALVEGRPILDTAAEKRDFDQMLPAKRRKELDRQLRRLAEEGAVSLMTARSPLDVEAAFDTFVAVEASGWKGRRGTAMGRKKRITEFAKAAVAGLAARGICEIDVMRCGDRAAAVLIRFEMDGLAVPWKIAYDESFAAFSPGKQLMSDSSRRWLRDGRINRVDPVCDTDNPMMSLLWPEREPYGTLLLSSRRWGLGIRYRRMVMNGKAAAKRHIKALIRR